jgi:cyclopropane-fatty-acyl-phospholipid synthase
MLLFRSTHWQRRNHKTGSRANIAAHYDLGNSFYRLFLDPSLMYSCAFFETPEQSLAQAAQAKLAQICRKLQLSPADHLLEIGTGWGGFALYAARHHGCRVTTTTISQEQYQLARERVTAAGLQDRIEVLLKDYRDLDGCYDKLVSIEMIEAVGHAHFDRYFSSCSRLLADDGIMLLQAITIADQEYERAKKEVDFIQKYIFPGGCLPSLTALSQSLTRATDMRIVHLEDIGPHYALTLRHWRKRFMNQLEQVRAQGFSESFIRMWEYYLCYCEGGFAERALGTVQLVLSKPLSRHEPILIR